jgi:hypothetical protein
MKGSGKPSEGFYKVNFKVDDKAAGIRTLFYAAWGHLFSFQ